MNKKWFRQIVVMVLLVVFSLAVQPAVLAAQSTETAPAQTQHGRQITHHKKNFIQRHKTAAIVGGSALGGAAIGGLAGGKKGAAIGALAGAGGGYLYDKKIRRKKNPQ